MILVVDHHDSFVYNLVQLLRGLGRETLVVSSDGADPRELVALRPEAVVLSPGPGRPEEAGCMVELLRLLDGATPVLGVCLGHQALGVAHGARVCRAPVPVHGKVSLVHHTGEGVLAGLPSPFEAGRYHSLAIDPSSLPEELVVTAHSEDGVVMGVRHRRLPRFGVQFHPESILTPLGPRIVENFLSLVGDP
ncbi:MAG TPA: aminodeoxychorismate/anthranilate synthase component II [Actinomycetota bacterium]|nr:aminodeoxychorismate/anthranilate synthase component II [Actinomycetota bacterium]